MRGQETSGRLREALEFGVLQSRLNIYLFSPSGCPDKQSVGLFLYQVFRQVGRENFRESCEQECWFCLECFAIRGFGK